MQSYYCSPFKDSEWRLGWNRAVEAARNFEVFVITSECSRNDIESYLRQNGVIPNLRFFYVDCELRRAWRNLLSPFLPMDGRRKANTANLAHKLHARYQFDLVHQVSSRGLREPGHDMNIPFVLGPLDCSHCYPVRFLAFAGLAGGFRKASVCVVNWLQMRFSRRVCRALKSAAVVLVANLEEQRAVENHHRREAILFVETGIDTVTQKTRAQGRTESLRILWSGDLISQAAISLLLRGLAAVGSEIKFELRVVGSGPLRTKAPWTVGQSGAEGHPNFLRFLPLQQAMAQWEWADIFVFTSLSNTSGDPMLEAMSRGIPVISLAHGGAADIVTKESGIKIAVTNPKRTINNIAKALVSLGQDRQLLTLLSEGALHRAEHILGSCHRLRLTEIYKHVLNGSPKRSFSELEV